MSRSLTWVVTALLTAATAGAAGPLTYADFLRQMTDLDRLTHLQPGVTGGQFSSWDRGDLKRWGCNGDAGQYLRVEPNGEAVMVELDGPGCLYRIWSANPMGRLRIYLDGATTPSFDWDFAKLFTGQIEPFIRPIVYQRGGPQSASDAYLPIPFARKIKICADRKHGQYYHFNYLRFPAEQVVESFRLPLTAAEQELLRRVAEAWSKPGTDPKPALPGQTTSQQSAELPPGGKLVLLDRQGAGVIRGLRLKVQSKERWHQRKLVLQGTWDGAAWPQVLAPMGPFFGFDWETPEWGSLIAGCQKGTSYFYYPMPFRRSGRLELLSHLSKPAQVEVQVDWAPLDAVAADGLYFYARYRREPKCQTFDYPFVETAGRGHLVGITLQVDHPVPGWWGEGDEKVWVDDDQFPPWIGTGSEDYFGDAWGIRYLPAPSFGCSLDKGHWTCPYRWHFLDLIPFSKRLRMTIEAYGPNGSVTGPNEYEFGSVAYWYQQEVTPPFEQLRGVGYVGAKRPGEAPSRQEYHPAVFAPLGPDDLRTYGLALPFCQEAEDLYEQPGWRGRIVTDAELPYALNGERGVDFGQVKRGDVLAEFKLRVAEDAVYLPKLVTAPVKETAAVELAVDGQTCRGAGRPAANLVAMEGVFLAAGEHRVRLQAAEDGPFLLDALQLVTAPRERDALEAEDLTIVAATGSGPLPQPSAPMTGPSGGRFLEWHATAVGQGFVLKLPAKRPRAYVLGLRPMTGPHAGIIQAYVAGQPIGPSFDLYAPEKRPGPSVLPLGMVPGDVVEVELRLVGRNPASTAVHAGLDYFRFEPKLIGPETAAGVWAQVLRTRGCEHRIQDLGAEWLGGHHLWLQPCERGGWVEIGLNVPEDGEYDLVVRYTTSWDYAIVQAALDGQDLGGRFDCFTREVRLSQPLTLGRAKLQAGRHVLRFLAADKNAESKGHLMGIDYVALKRAP